MDDAATTARALVFIERWRHQDPALRLAEVYADDEGWAISAALYFELAECLFRIAEGHVREAKLGWWLEEVGHYADAAPRHPLTQAMHLRSVSAQAIRALVVAAAELMDAPAAENRTQLERQRRPLLLALGELMLQGKSQSVSGILADEWIPALTRWDDCFRLHSLGRQGNRAMPILSLAQQAELGVSRDQLATLTDHQLGAIRRQLSGSWMPPKPLPLPPLGVYCSLWTGALRRRGGAPSGNALDAISAWRVARRWRRQIAG